MDEKTLEDLKNAFAGESQANRKYLAFSKIAEKEGFKGVSLIFKAVAEAETIHALNHFKLFGVGSTADNLKAAIKGENYEVTTMYPEFKDDAENANESEALKTFNYAIEAEKIHEKFYIDALQKVLENEDMDVEKVSVCKVCGHTVIGDAPDECPVCGSKSKSYLVIE